jgi:hypothetical protein
LERVAGRSLLAVGAELFDVWSGQTPLRFQLDAELLGEFGRFVLGRD